MVNRFSLLGDRRGGRHHNCSPRAGFGQAFAVTRQLNSLLDL